MRFGDTAQSVAGFDEINRRAGDVGRVNRRGSLFWNRGNRTWLHGERNLGSWLLIGLRGRIRNRLRGCLNRSGRLILFLGRLGLFTHASFNEQADNNRDTDNDRSNDRFLKSFPAALLDIQLKAGWYLKRILRAHTLTAVAISIADAIHLSGFPPQPGPHFDLLQDSVSNFWLESCHPLCHAFPQSFRIFSAILRTTTGMKQILPDPPGPLEQMFYWKQHPCLST